MNVIGERFERSFVRESHANRIGFGTHRALRECQRFSRRFSFVLPVDLEQFFPSIDHQVLRRLLWRKIDCPATRRLIDGILDSGAGVLAAEYAMRWFPDDDLFSAARPRGLPIGNLTSQFWANVVLNPIDHFVKRELRATGYVRYVDDMLLFHDDLSILHDWKRRIEDRLARLRLTAHPGAHPRPVAEGISFLGFITFPDRRRLKSRKARHFHRKYRALREEARRGEIPWTAVTDSVRGWVNHAAHGNTWRLREAIFGKD